MNFIRHLLILGAALCIAGKLPAAEDSEKLKVLVVTGGHGFEKEPFFKMFQDNTEITFTTAAHASKTNVTVFEREDLLRFDTVVLYDMPSAITDAQKAKFLSLFEKGIGLVVLHHALVSYPNWPEYEHIIGGRYQEPDPNKPGRVTEQVGWQHDVEVPVVIVATNHPVTAWVKDFTLHDEIYWGFRVSPDVTPLITTSHPKSGKPLGWCRAQGKSRVVFLQPGHGKAAFNDANYRRLLAQAIRWAARASGSSSVKTSEALLPKVFLLDARHLVKTREKIRAGDKRFNAALSQLKRDANSALKAEPRSVMDKDQMPPSGDKHDYLSLAPYFWPDPESPNGLPYIRRDGERNQDIYKISDRRSLSEMSDAVETLALAWFFTGNEEYAAKAAAILRVWFLDSATRMNPNLEYAQGIPGVNTGRGTGLIETANLPGLVDSIGLLAGSRVWSDADQQGMQKWSSEFLSWMRESKNGRQEAAAKNNHGTYYDVQVVSLALFTGQQGLASNVIEEVKTKRIIQQIEPDGRQPHELGRTKSWGYSVMNLRGLMNLAALGEYVGVDLWRYETDDGRGIRKAVDYLLPYALREKKWPYQQIGGWSADGYYSSLRLAALKFDDPKYRAAAAKDPMESSSRSKLLRPGE
jgi:type 1 glutamine amidotransferase